MNKMEIKLAGLWFIRVGDSFTSSVAARQAADEVEVLYNLSCVVEKVGSQCYIFARGPKYNLEASDNVESVYDEDYKKEEE